MYIGILVAENWFVDIEAKFLEGQAFMKSKERVGLTNYAQM